MYNAVVYDYPPLVVLGKDQQQAGRFGSPPPVRGGKRCRRNRCHLIFDSNTCCEGGHSTLPSRRLGMPFSSFRLKYQLDVPVEVLVRVEKESAGQSRWAVTSLPGVMANPLLVGDVLTKQIRSWKSSGASCWSNIKVFILIMSNCNVGCRGAVIFFSGCGIQRMACG